MLRLAAITGAGIASAAALAACTTPTQTATPSAEAASPSHDHASGSPGAVDTVDHDALMVAGVKSFVGGEWQKVPTPYGTQLITPRMDGDTKVFDMTIDRIKHQTAMLAAPLDALGYNGTWPGPTIRVTEGDKVRTIFKNNLLESTGVHYHGVRIPNKFDGVPGVTQDPIKPGESYAAEFTLRNSGSHMYHSHHNATDQVGRGLLGAFIVDPKDPAQRPDRKYGVTQDVVWISNDSLGGFTINGRGFPATKPLAAKLGERIYVRFMNEGVMMHPWHLHGLDMEVVARDGRPLGSAAFTCDTLSVAPGERWDVVIDCNEPGVWAFHCHILPHVEGPDGMFGMVTALIVS
jgi:FtsP/CotA-like multicopper oxidase with cupredoxin domain